MGICASSQSSDYTKGLNRKQIKELSTASMSNAYPETYDFTSAKVLQVYDGDTFQIAAFHNNKLVRFPVRLYGVDTPEMDSKDEQLRLNAEEAAVYTRGMILNRIIHIEILTNTRVYDKSKRGRMVKGKYGRLLANVYIDNQSLAEMLITRGLGIAYFGGTK